MNIIVLITIYEARTMATSQDRGSIFTAASKLAKKANTVDVDEALTNEGLRSSGGSKYSRDGTLFANADNWQKFCNAVLDESFKSMGIGSSNNVLQNFLSRLDRHGNTYAPSNTMNYGYTFITRPRFNMTTGNLLGNPITALLANSSEINANNVSFMIRMLLDTRLCRGSNIFRTANTSPEDTALTNAAETSGLLDIRNPFFTPLCNGLRGISGWPDFNLETATMGEDFHSGDFTFVKGSDMLVRSSELSLEFVDVQGSIVLSCIFYWCLIMALQAKGIMMAYPDDIYEQRLNYTVSIYRFVTDATRRNILWWSKATGCFPKSAPIGQLFNINQGEVTVSSAKQFSIPFAVNVVEYNNPGILFDFKELVRRYAGKEFDDVSIWPLVPDHPNTRAPLPYWNYVGLPDIITGKTGLELVWRTNKTYYGDSWPKSTLSATRTDVEAAEPDILTEVSNNINTATSKLNMQESPEADNTETLRKHPANTTYEYAADLV